ncbi:A24 family peptidase [Vibrio breoganii]
MHIIEMIDWLKSYEPITFYALVFCYSAALASFLNVLLFRMPIIVENQFRASTNYVLAEHNRKGVPLLNQRYSTLLDRSYCPHCSTKIPLWHNIPVLSWLLLKGQTKCCKNKISAWYFIIEAGFATTAACLFFAFSTEQALVLTFTLYLGIAIAHFDLKHQIIPDVYTYILLWTALFSSLFLNILDTNILILHTALGYTSLYIFNGLYSKLRKKTLLGLGDVKLLSVCCGLLPVPYVFSYFPLLLSFVACLAIIFQTAKKSQALDGRAIAFAPSIIISLFISLLYLYQ